LKSNPMVQVNYGPILGTAGLSDLDVTVVWSAGMFARSG
jgi:hypothetical protein